MGAAGKKIEVRPSGRKVRHNKVNTAKGLRDRRVRLSPDTAIQFYDVQDRLGYERASEALDWLMQKAKHSIDNLFDTSSQVDALGEYNAESILPREDQICQHRLQNFHNLEYNSANISDDSTLFPYNQFQGSAMPSYQEMLEKGQIQKTNMFGSKSNSSGDHFVFNYEASAAITHNDDSSLDQPSVIQTSEPSSDDLAMYYVSNQSHGDQGQFVSFNHSFISDASFPSWMTRF